MEKSADAFRTISEVAEDLVLPQHVLRFWEQRFPQIRPLKRAGGRRYYRPADVVLLRSIRQLLHDEGYTIKGVQRLLKEQGARGLRVGEPTLARDHSADIAAMPPEPRGTAPEATAPGSVASMTFDRGELEEALLCIEECERILTAVLRSPA